MLSALLWVWLGAASADPGPMSQPEGEAGPRLVAICIDGLNADVFERLLAEGRLPGIARLMARQSSTHGRVLSSFPSSTAPSVPELLTGRFADRTAAMPRAIHVFDREARTARRYSLEPAAWEDGTPTLFTLLDSRGETSFSLFEGRFEGSESVSSKRALMVGGLLELLHLPVYNPDHSLIRRFRNMVEVRGGPPRVVFLALNAVDTAGHLRSPDSRRYEDALEDADRLLERELFDWMDGYILPGGASYLETATVAIYGDHGMETTGRFVDLARALRREGLRAVDMGTVFQVVVREKLSHRWSDKPDAVLAPGGSNVTQVYLRHPDGTWGDGPAEPARTEPVAEMLARVPGVEFVIRRVGPWALEVRAAGCRRAVLAQTGDGADRRFAYRVARGEGPDPFGYLLHPEAAALIEEVDDPALVEPARPESFHSFGEWHLATADTEYPAAVPLVLKGCATGPTQGDLVITAARGYSFLRHTTGDHGGLRRDSILTELVLAGPRVRRVAMPEEARLIDLLPTFLKLLGLELEPDLVNDLDGRVLPGVVRDLPPRGYLLPLRALAASPPASHIGLDARHATR